MRYPDAYHRVVENRVEHSLPGSFRRPSAGNCGCGGQHRMVGAGPPKHHEGARHRGANRGAHARQRQARGRVLLPPDLSRMPRSAPEGIVIIDGVDAGRYPEVLGFMGVPSEPCRAPGDARGKKNAPALSTPLFLPFIFKPLTETRKPVLCPRSFVHFDEHASLCEHMDVTQLPFFHFYKGARGRVAEESLTKPSMGDGKYTDYTYYSEGVLFTRAICLHCTLVERLRSRDSPIGVPGEYRHLPTPARDRRAREAPGEGGNQLQGGKAEYTQGGNQSQGGGGGILARAPLSRKLCTITTSFVACTGPPVPATARGAPIGPFQANGQVRTCILGASHRCAQDVLKMCSRCAQNKRVRVRESIIGQTPLHTSKATKPPSPERLVILTRSVSLVQMCSLGRRRVATRLAKMDPAKMSTKERYGCSDNSICL
eukprot:1185652-Prorocentrum_minimum.AAC.3